ncbi:MAG TPA: molybdenum cofactor guanylyltransferase [Pirellulaceae bacterium]|nr:molybdenum cofactor guanylyltransferase [Pirellulaceae bacterium]
MLRVGGIVLCGGHSKRMGRTKALLPFGDELLLTRMVRLLSQAVQPIAIVAAADADLAALAEQTQLGHSAVPLLWTRDARPDRGPLEGVRAGLTALADLVDAVYITSCDAPLLVPAFVERMIVELNARDCAVPMELNARGAPLYHPLAAVYRTNTLPVVERLLASEQLRLGALFEHLVTRAVPIDDLRAVDPELATLRNANNPAEYQRVLQAAGIVH